MRGSKRCMKHGGKSLKGIASPRWKNGLRSKYMPKALGARFNAAMADPELLKLEKDVGLVEARLLELIHRVEEAGAAQLWRNVQAAFSEFQDALRGGDKAVVAVALNDLGDRINRGAADWQTWGEIMQVIEQRRKLIDSIHKHEVQSAEIVTLTEAQVLFSGMAHLVREHVKDKQALRAIAEGFAKLTQGPVALLPAKVE
jgi:hypothetical protein